jgi:hypothetical protein
MKFEFVQPRFSEGVLAKSLQGRSSEEFYKYGLKGAKNMLPILSGPVVKRPGTNYIGVIKDLSAIFIPFFKDKDNTYILEIGQTHATLTTGGYLRLWSQDQLLVDRQSSPAIYEVTAGVTWTRAELLKLKFTQSGDYIFVCCPTKTPQIIKRVITLTGGATADYALDDSVWTVYPIVLKDGPYKEINVYSESDATERYALYKAEPSTKVKIGGVEFNTVTNHIVLPNHGLQVGMKVRLDDDDQETSIPYVTGNSYFDSVTADNNLNGWGAIVGDNENSTTSDATKLGDADYYIISTTSTSFQVSTTDGGSALEFMLYESKTAADAKVNVWRYVDKAATTVDLTVYKNSTADNDLFTTANDAGRLIRINPLSRPLNRIGGIRWCWGIINSISGNNINVTLKTEMANIRGGTPSGSNIEAGTTDFRVGAFSINEGFPTVSQIYQQRMVFAATKLQPSTVWLSETNNFYSFAPSELPAQDSPSSIINGEAIEVITSSSALTFTLDSDTLDQIKWIAESKKMTMGTSAGVYMLYGSETNLVVTPFRFTINRESSFSATDTPPVVVSNALMYAQIGGKDVQQLLFEGQQGQWFNSKISIKGYDVIKTSTIKKMVWQERPNNVIWMMMDDGRLLSLSYDRQTAFQAWSEHVISGTNAKVTDIEMIATSTHDQIWMKVERTIGGVTKYYMETMARFPTEGALARNALVFLDSAITTTQSGGVVSGLAHLDGESVSIYYDGMQHINKTVASGAITLDNTAGSNVVVGLAYNGELETLEPTAPENQYSYSKQVKNISLLIEESLGIKIEYGDENEEILFRTSGDLMGKQIPLFSGKRKLSLSGMAWEDFDIKIVSNGPFPMQINSIVLEAETGGS